jgi:hypothetical protein
LKQGSGPIAPTTRPICDFDFADTAKQRSRRTLDMPAYRSGNVREAAKIKFASFQLYRPQPIGFTLLLGENVDGSVIRQHGDPEES